MNLIPPERRALFRAHVGDQFASWQTLLAKTGYTGALVAAGETQPLFQDDQSLPFKPSPWFLSWLPLQDRPGSYIWVAADAQRPKLYCHHQDDMWHGVEPLREPVIEECFDVDTRADVDHRVRRLSGPGKVAFLGKPAGCPPGMEPNPQPLLQVLDYRRACKSPYELSCLQAANGCAVRGHLAARRLFEQGASEFDIHLGYLAATRQLDEELPYPNIIALNEHAATLHYTRRCRQPPTERRSLLIDAGVSCAGYAADISRTWTCDPDFQALVDEMEILQQQLTHCIQPGLWFTELHQKAHRLLAELLVNSELVSCSPDAALDTGLTRLFFPHGLGHLLGLQVHDRGGWLQSETGELREPPAEDPFLRLTRQLQEGQVFTVEPGLYFIPMLLQAARADARSAHINWRRVEQLQPCGGIRIEDNIAVTAQGIRNITREAFAAAGR